MCTCTYVYIWLKCTYIYIIINLITCKCGLKTVYLLIIGLGKTGVSHFLLFLHVILNNATVRTHTHTHTQLHSIWTSGILEEAEF